MSHATLQTTIEGLFLNAWKLRSSSRVILDNGVMVEWVTEIIDLGGPGETDLSSWRPVDPSVQDLDPYVTVQVWDGKSGTVTIGGPVKRRRTVGTAFFEISVPRQSGTIVARGMADEIKDIFRDVMTGGIEFFEGSVGRGSERYYANNGSALPETSQKWVIPVAVPYRYDVDV